MRLDTNTASIPSGTYADAINVGRGLYVPKGWGANLRAALGGTKPVVAVVGDSIAFGALASVLKGPTATSWVGQLRTYLQSLYGDGGSGFQPARENSTAITTMGPWTLPVTLTGAWSDYAAGDGPGPGTMYSAVNGATMTTVVRGSTVKVYYLNGVTGGAASWTVDGVAQTPIATTGVAGVGVATATGLSSGDHIVVVTLTAASNLFIHGFGGENATGLVLNNFARSGGGSSYVNNVGNTYSPGGQWSGGSLYPADLVIYAYGANDAVGNGLTPDAYIANVHKYLTGVVNPAGLNFPASTLVPGTDPKVGAVDVMFTMPHIGEYDGNLHYWAEYMLRLRGLAEHFGAAFADLGAIYRNNYNYFASLNGWGTTATPGAAGADVIHPSDAGHALYYAQVKAVIDRAIAGTT